jgi:hypothetical protein
MRVHQNQVNQYAQLDAVAAAQKAEAKKAAERTRKKLVESASKLAGEAEAEACVVELNADQESNDEPKQKSEQRPRNRRQPTKGANSPEANSISDWA